MGSINRAFVISIAQSTITESASKISETVRNRDNSLLTIGPVSKDAS